MVRTEIAGLTCHLPMWHTHLKAVASKSFVDILIGVDTSVGMKCQAELEVTKIFQIHREQQNNSVPSGKFNNTKSKIDHQGGRKSGKLPSTNRSYQDTNAIQGFESSSSNLITVVVLFAE